MENKVEHLTPYEVKKLARVYFKNKGRIINFQAVELKSGWVLILRIGQHESFDSHDVYISDPQGLIKTFLTFTELINVAIFISDGVHFNMKVIPYSPFSARDRA